MCIQGTFKTRNKSHYHFHKAGLLVIPSGMISQLQVIDIMLNDHSETT